MATSTMLEAIFHPRPTPHVTLQLSSIPDPPSGYLLIKVVVASSNPKDWALPTSRNQSLNSGDDLAGIVSAIGHVTALNSSFQIGDRVAGFHPMFSSGGAYAEYAVVPAATTFHIPSSMSFEEASTIPLVATTAALTLFRRQRFPSPWSQPESDSRPTPLIVYGASSSLGTFTIKLARLRNIHPLIAIAGASAGNITALLEPSKGDILLDYRVGSQTLLNQVVAHLDSLNLHAYHAIDAISDGKSWIPLSQMLSPGGILSVVNGAESYTDAAIPSWVKIVYTYVGAAHSGSYLPQMPKQPPAEEVKGDVGFAADFFKWLEDAMEEGRMSGHPFEVVARGLGGVGEGLRRLREGKARGRKMVYRIDETQDINGYVYRA